MSSKLTAAELLALLEQRSAAIDEADDVLSGSVCECGHIGANHSSPRRCDALAEFDGAHCECLEFRPVDFAVVTWEQWTALIEYLRGRSSDS